VRRVRRPLRTPLAWRCRSLLLSRQQFCARHRESGQQGPWLRGLRGLATGASPWDPLRAFGAHVLDFSMQRHIPMWQQIRRSLERHRALMLLSAVKKALLQSAPWMLVGDGGYGRGLAAR